MRKNFSVVLLSLLVLATGCKREPDLQSTSTPATTAQTSAPTSTPTGAPAAQQHFRVAAAISLKESLTEIAAEYAKENPAEIAFDYGASGQLLGQIKNGVPIDVFISAANAQVADLDKAGLADMSTRRLVATNALVLIVPASAAPDARPTGFEDLGNAKFKRIAAGEPKTVPAGQYAAEVFKSLKLEEVLKDRLVFGTNVRQVLDYVERGEVDAGIVYATDAKQSGSKVVAIATAEPAWHKPIEYPGLVVKPAANAAAGKAWLDYLGTEKAVAILKNKGFTMAGPATKPAE